MAALRGRSGRGQSVKEPVAVASSAAIFHIIAQSRSTGTLNLSSRSLREVPAAVFGEGTVGTGQKEIGWWEVAELSKLDLSRNEITNLPEAIWSFTSLTSVDLSSNKLASLPEGIGALDLLRSLALSSNPLGALPPATTGLTALAGLQCSSCQLDHLPEGLGGPHQPAFAVLQASQNRLASLPSSLGDATALIKLHLSNNALDHLPEQVVAGWVSLQELDLQFNRLKVLPDAFGSLPRLQLLNVSQNQLSQLPASLCRASALLELHAGYNQIQELPHQLGMLAQLRLLNVCNNHILELPVPVCSLPLSLLDLRNNNLRALPAELGNMTTLRSVPLDGNPLKLIRRELWAGPVSGLLEFLRSRLTDSNTPGSNRTSSAGGAPPWCAGQTAAGSSLSRSSSAASRAGGFAGGLGGRAGSLSTGDSSQLGPVVQGIADMGLSSSDPRVAQVQCSGPRSSALSCVVPPWADESCQQPSISTAPTFSLPLAAAAASGGGGARGPRQSVQGHVHGRELVLRGRGLTELPEDLAQAAGHITLLDLSSNPLAYIAPSLLVGFSCLRVLQVSSMGLTSWPLPLDAPGALSCLTTLDLSANPCQLLPPAGLVACPQLRSMDLSGVPGAAVLPVAFFDAVPQLESLVLVNVPLGSCIGDLIMQLPASLKVLNLAAAQLTNLPAEVTRLLNLQELDLTNNSLSSLPPTLGMMHPQLRLLRLDGNCFRTIRRQVLEKGTQAILEYLKDRLPVR